MLQDNDDRCHGVLTNNEKRTVSEGREKLNYVEQHLGDAVVGEHEQLQRP